MVLVAGFACAGQAQVYQVGQGSNAQSTPAKPAQRPSAQPQNSQTLGWGSNIQNARLANAAQMAIRQGNKAQAVDYAQRAAQAAPNDASLWFLLGYAARLDSRYQLALDSYSHGLRLKPGSLDGQSGLAQVYSVMGRDNEAEQILKKILAADPSRRNDAQLLGATYMHGRDYPNAIRWLTAAERLRPDARSELLLALCYQQLKQMDKASHYLKMAIRRAPNNPDVQRSLAGYYREMGNYSGAIAALMSIQNPSPDVIAELAYTYQLDGDANQSARYYSQAANARTGDLSLQLAAAQAEVAAGSIPHADLFLKRAQRINANSYRLYALRGQIAQLQDRNADAVKQYRAAIAHLPANPAEGPLYAIQLHMDLVTLDRTLGDTDDAGRQLAIAQNAIQGVESEGPNREQYLRLRALIQFSAGDAEGALKDIDAAMAANPSDRANLQLDGDILMKLGRTDDAIAAYTRILKQDKNNRYALTSLGYAERAAGNPRQAEKYFKRLARAYPKLYVPYLALGDLYTARKEYAKAQASYTEARERAPHNALVVAGGITAAIEAHDLKLARVWVARVEPSMEREPLVLREEERYFSFKGDYQRSAELGEQAIKLLPRDRDVVVYLGYDYLYLQKYDALLALTTKYMNLLPKEADIPLLAGYVYKHNGQEQQAEQAFTEAIKRDPNTETAYVNRGYMRNDLHDPAGAAADFETALKLDPKDGQAHLGLAYSSLDLGKDGEALRQASIAEKTMGNIRDVHVIRATAYGAEGLETKAASEYRAALAFTPNDGKLRLGLGNALLSLRRYPEAISELKLAAQYDPGDPNPYALLARCYAHLQDRAQTLHFADLAEARARSKPGPEQSLIFVFTGEAFSELGDQNAAMDRFRRALEVKGSNRVGVRLAIAQLMARENQPTAAERQIALALMEAEAGAAAPPTGMQYIAAADVFRSLHDYQLSQNYLERAKNANAPDADVRIGMANNYLALGETARARAELDAVSATADSEPTYQFLMAKANVFRQEHENPQAQTSFAQAVNAAGDEETAEQSLLETGGSEGLRLNNTVSLLSDYSLQPIYEDSTIYVLDSKLDAGFAIPSDDTSLLPPPRSSIQNQGTAAFHLHLPHVPTPTGFFQVRNARGLISAPSSYCGPGSTPSTICTLIVNRDTTDYNLNFGLNPTLHFGRNMAAVNGGIQGTIRRDALEPAQMNQNLFREFLYGSTNSLFNAVSVSGYFIHESGPFTQMKLRSRALTGAVDFRVGTPWSSTALLLGWGASDIRYNPQTYEAYFTSSYAGFDHSFGGRAHLRAMLEDVRAWRIVGANSAIAQNLRPSAQFAFSPRRNWRVLVNGAYSNTRSFHVYDNVQSGISVSYALPFRRKFNDGSGPLTFAYPIRFSGGVQDDTFFNFTGGQQQLRPYIEVSIF